MNYEGYSSYGHNDGDILWIYYKNVIVTELEKNRNTHGSFSRKIFKSPEEELDMVWRGRYDIEEDVITMVAPYNFKGKVPLSVVRKLKTEFGTSATLKEFGRPTNESRIMKFRLWLKEKRYSQGGTFMLFVNPSRKELNELIKFNKNKITLSSDSVDAEIRWIWDFEKKDLYMWAGDELHKTIINKYPINFNSSILGYFIAYSESFEIHQRRVIPQIEEDDAARKFLKYLKSKQLPTKIDMNR